MERRAGSFSQPPASCGETLPPVTSFASSSFTLCGSRGPLLPLCLRSLPTAAPADWVPKAVTYQVILEPPRPAGRGREQVAGVRYHRGRLEGEAQHRREENTRQQMWGESPPLSASSRLAGKEVLCWGGNPGPFLTLFFFRLLCAPLKIPITSQRPSVWVAGP